VVGIIPVCQIPLRPAHYEYLLWTDSLWVPVYGSLAYAYCLHTWGCFLLLRTALTCSSQLALWSGGGGRGPCFSETMLCWGFSLHLMQGIQWGRSCRNPGFCIYLPISEPSQINYGSLLRC
jgi:hypothetical protein